MSVAEPAPVAADSPPRIPAVHIQRVNHYYGEGEAVQPGVVRQSIWKSCRAKIVIMTGPSGSGKTTLLTLIGGLRTVQEGSVRIYGRELKGLAGRDLVEIRRGIGFIFQLHNLFDSRRVSEREDRAGTALRQWSRSRRRHLASANACTSATASLQAQQIVRRPTVARGGRPRPGAPPKPGTGRRTDRRPGREDRPGRRELPESAMARADEPDRHA